MERRLAAGDGGGEGLGEDESEAGVQKVKIYKSTLCMCQKFKFLMQVSAF